MFQKGLCGSKKLEYITAMVILPNEAMVYFSDNVFTHSSFSDI